MRYTVFMRIKSEQVLQEVAEQFIQTLQPKKSGATIIALQGDLGAGKTTFVRACLRALGVDASITSPTFVLQKEYDLKGQKWEKALHIDAYRLEKYSDLAALDWEKNTQQNTTLIFVEWPEQVGVQKNADSVVNFEYISETEREVVIG